MLNYKINTATTRDLLMHFKACNNQFNPVLSERVNLEVYAIKLFEKSVTFEAWNSTKLIGMIAAYFNSEKLSTGFISNVSVLSNFENKGIASKLLNDVKDYAKNNGYKSLSLEVNENNLNAISLYRKYNFKQISKEFDVLTMRFLLK